MECSGQLGVRSQLSSHKLYPHKESSVDKHWCKMKNLVYFFNLSDFLTNDIVTKLVFGAGHHYFEDDTYLLVYYVNMFAIWGLMTHFKCIIDYDHIYIVQTKSTIIFWKVVIWFIKYNVFFSFKLSVMHT